MIGSSKSVSGFDPRTIPGCQLWLDGADSTTITGTTSVTAWRDKSANGYVANSFVNSVPNPSWVPNIRNGNGVIQYSAGNGSSIANFVLAQTMSIFKVYYPINQSTSSPFIEQGPNAGSESGFFFHSQNDNNFYIKAGSVGIANFGTTTVSNTWQMIEGINPDPANGNTMAFYVNGTTRASGGTQSDTTTVTKTLYINGRAGTTSVSYNNYLAELIIYNIAVTTTQRQQVEGYLAHKWGLTGYYDSSIPLTIPGCQLWLDAADSSTVTGTTSVTQWRDKSGNGRNTTTTGTISYANSGISITSSSSYLTGSFGTPDYTGSTLTSFIVASMNSASGSVARLFSLGKVGTQDWDNLASITLGRGGGLLLRPYRTVPTSSPPSIPAYDTRFIGTWGQTSSLLFNSINGGALSTASLSGAFAINAYRIGNDLLSDDVNEQFNGVINEIILYFSELTTTQRQTIEGYLSKKWGLTSLYPSIPSTHPFSSVRPHLRGFQPTDVPGCQLWLDGADQTSMTLSGSSVTQWNDKSGNGYNAFPNAGGSAITMGTLNGVPAITFPAASSAAFLPSSSLTVGSGGYSVFFVANQTGFGSGGTRIYAANGGGIQSAMNDTPPRILTLYNGSSITSTFTVISNVPFLYSYTISSTASGLWKNGISAGTAGGSTTSISNFYIGNYSEASSLYAFTGQMGEFLVYNTGLTTSQRQQVEGYLAHKWGLVPSYPTNIPLSIPGCQLWLDAADSSSLVLSGSSVTTWNDKSGNGYHMNTLTATATWSGGATYPTIGTSINGRTTVNFSPQAGLRQSTTLDGVKNLFWVGRIAAPTGSGGGSAYFLLGTATDNTSGYDWHAEAYGGKFLDPVNSQSGIRNATASLITSDPNAVTNATFSSVNMPSAPNVSLLSVTGITGFTRYQGICFDRVYHIGWCGDLAEVLIYTIPLTSTQREQIEVYLSQKWGLIQSGQFSSTHPFTRFPPASLPFSPRNISGLTLWLDAADISTLTVSGSNVSSWRDKSGNNNNATQPTLANQPTIGTLLNGLNVLDFTGTQPYFSFPTISFTNITVFTIFRNTTLRAYCSPLFIGPFFFFFTDGAGNNLYGTGRLGINGEGIISQAAAGITTTNYLLYSLNLTVGGTDIVNFYINGRNTANFNGSASGGRSYYQVGSTDSVGATTGFIAEILVYNGVLNNSQRQQVEGYLAHKWGLASSLFTPLEIPGCQLWLDAADSSTITYGTGSSVASWRDKANGYAVANSSAAYRPIYSQGTIRFTGTTNPSYLDIPTLTIGSSAFSIFFVMQNTGPASGNASAPHFFWPLSGNGSGALSMTGWLSTNIQGINANIISTLLKNQYYIISYTFGVTTNFEQLYANGISIGTYQKSSGYSASLYRLGGIDSSLNALSFDGNIGEMLVYNTALTTSQRQRIEGYLSQKWGLGVSSTNPSTHPFSKFPPA